MTALSELERARAQLVADTQRRLASVSEERASSERALADARAQLATPQSQAESKLLAEQSMHQRTQQQLKVIQLKCMNESNVQSPFSLLQLQLATLY